MISDFSKYATAIAGSFGGAGSTLFRPRVLFRVLMQGRGSSAANPHGFDIHKLADSEIRKFASVARIFDAAKRQPRI